MNIKIENRTGENAVTVETPSRISVYGDDGLLITDIWLNDFEKPHIQIIRVLGKTGMQVEVIK